MYKLDEALLEKYAALYPKGNAVKKIAETWYGTAGFRMKATDLPHIVFRMGLFACVRSQFCRAAVGLMLTASHNPVCDNGIKLIDPNGDVLDISWESYASQLANCDDDVLLSTLHSLIAEVKDSQWKPKQRITSEENMNQCDFSDYQPTITLGRDTRPSCAALCDATIAGASCFKAHTADYGLVTTPMLHYIVRCINDTQWHSSSQNGRPDEMEPQSRSNSANGSHTKPNGASQFQLDQTDALKYEIVYGVPSLNGYYQKLACNFTKLLRLFGVKRNERPALTVDCANGVGHIHVRVLGTQIAPELLRISLVNVGDGELNKGCGADFVKIEQRFPQNIHPPTTDGAAGEHEKSNRFMALDGDADRIVYFYATKTGECRLLDGDKIALLLARFVARLLREAQPHARLRMSDSAQTDAEADLFDVRFGVVQTAYANGSSTEAIASIGCNIEASCVATGVKFLLAKAIEYDVGVFFEANGHGTVLFSDRLKQRLRNSLREQYSVEVDRLLTAINIVNETVGDSLSDMLLIEAILAIESMSVSDWDALYADLPSRQLKVVVPDRSRIRTTPDERRIVEPAALQTEIDRLVDAVHCGTLCDAKGDKSARSFVRPSGTEDVVRVYAEATLQTTADILAQRVADMVRTFLNANRTPI